MSYPSGDGASVAKAMEAEDHRPYQVSIFEGELGGRKGRPTWAGVEND